MRCALRGTILVSLCWAVLAPSALGAGLGGEVPVGVSPGRGRVNTKFVVRFKIPDATGTAGNVNVSDAVSVRGPDRRGCVGQAEIPLRTAPAHTAFRITLNPSHLNGHWCAGRYAGTLIERRSLICGPLPVGSRIVCPLYVVAPRVIGSFSFRVTPPSRADV